MGRSQEYPSIGAIGIARKRWTARVALAHLLLAAVAQAAEPESVGAAQAPSAAPVPPDAGHRSAGELRVGAGVGAVASGIGDCHDERANAVAMMVGGHFALGGAITPRVVLAPTLDVTHAIRPPSREVRFLDYSFHDVLVTGVGVGTTVKGDAGLHGGVTPGVAWNNWRSGEGAEDRFGVGLATYLGFDRCGGGHWCAGPVLRVLASYGLTNRSCNTYDSDGSETRPWDYALTITLGVSTRYHGWR